MTSYIKFIYEKYFKYKARMWIYSTRPFIIFVEEIDLSSITLPSKDELKSISKTKDLVHIEKFGVRSYDIKRVRQ